MTEYIEREAALNQFEYTSSAIPEKWARIRIEEIPAADVVPVRHGRWMSYYGTEYAKAVKVSDFGSVSQEVFCSECGAYLGGSAEYEVKGNYCPNCGALMNKDGDGDV